MLTLLSFQRYGKEQIISFMSTKRDSCVETLDQKVLCSLKFCFIIRAFGFLSDQIMIVLIFLCLLKNEVFYFFEFLNFILFFYTAGSY